MLQHDKALHFSTGGVVSVLPHLITPWWGGPIPWWWPVAAAAVAGLGKELYDHLHPETHTVDPFDFLATAAGALPVALTLGVLHGY